MGTIKNIVLVFYEAFDAPLIKQEKDLLVY
jgi:hypothetical protein